MSGYYTDEPDHDERELERGNSGGGLRKMLEETLAENKKLLERLNGKERSESVAELLAARELDPAIAELIPKDEADPKGWLDQRAHLFGAKVTTEEEEASAAPEIQVAPDDDPALVAEREALAAMQDAAESGYPTAVSNDLLERMNKINSEEELLKFFNSNGLQGG